MPVLWIIHRDPHMREAIARLALAGDDTILGAPGDPFFDEAPTADVVLLGLTERRGDFEAELQFVHRHAPRLRRAAWILLPDAGEEKEVRRLFDAIDAEVLSYSPDIRTLQWRLRSAPTRLRSHSLPLSQRPARDALTTRFALWFADLELPGVMRAIDPRMADVPVLISGEPGTGRGLMVRYIHTFGGTSEGALVRVACDEQTDIAQITAAISSRAETERARNGCLIWLEDVDQLAPAIQRELQGWIDFAPPEGLVHTYRLRWIGTLGDGPPLEPALEHALADLLVDIPPLRDRPQLIVPFANDAALTWCAARAEGPRRFDDDAAAALHAHPWRGNLRELESVVVQSLAASSSNPLGQRDLRYGGAPFAPSTPAAPSVTAPAPSPVAPAAEVIGREEVALQPKADEEILESEFIATVAPPSGDGAAPGRSDALRRLADAVAHEVRNPLSSIRTFAQLLPSHFDDDEFRTQFSMVVNRDVERAAGIPEKLSEYAAFGEPTREPVDATGLIEQLLEARRGHLRERRLLALTELDHDRPLVIGDATQLRFAFALLLDQAIDLLPERGELFLASKHHDLPEAGGSSMRILVRCGEATGGPGWSAKNSPLRHSLSLVLAEWIALAQGGRFAIDSAEGAELVILIDLPAP